jgi:HSP20 family protein
MPVEERSMQTSSSSPFDAIFALQRALDARRQSDWFGSSTAGTGAFPPINIFQQGDDFVAIVELPGVEKVNLHIEAKESTIRISGKKEIGFERSASVHRRERTSGSFDRTFSLPIEINAEGIRADYRNGVLTLTVPRAESQKPRNIKIS